MWCLVPSAAEPITDIDQAFLWWIYFTASHRRGIQHYGAESPASAPWRIRRHQACDRRAIQGGGISEHPIYIAMTTCPHWQDTFLVRKGIVKKGSEAVYFLRGQNEWSFKSESSRVTGLTLHDSVVFLHAINLTHSYMWQRTLGSNCAEHLPSAQPVTAHMSGVVCPMWSDLLLYIRCCTRTPTSLTITLRSSVFLELNGFKMLEFWEVKERCSHCWSKLKWTLI